MHGYTVHPSTRGMTTAKLEGVHVRFYARIQLGLDPAGRGMMLRSCLSHVSQRAYCPPPTYCLPLRISLGLAQDEEESILQVCETAIGVHKQVGGADAIQLSGGPHCPEPGVLAAR